MLKQQRIHKPKVSVKSSYKASFLQSRNIDGIGTYGNLRLNSAINLRAPSTPSGTSSFTPVPKLNSLNSGKLCFK